MKQTPRLSPLASPSDLASAERRRQFQEPEQSIFEEQPATFGADSVTARTATAAAQLNPRDSVTAENIPDPAGDHIRHVSESAAAASAPAPTGERQEQQQHHTCSKKKRGHFRRTSEPPGIEHIISTNDDTSDKPKVNRRQLFERGWSTSDLSRRKAVTAFGGTASDQSNKSAATRSAADATAGASPVAPNFSDFHATWTNCDGTDFLGESSLSSSIYSAQGSFRGSFQNPLRCSTSSAEFGLERPELGRRISTSPRMDDTGLSSMIHDAARITDWDRVLLLCESNPECAKYCGSDGWTALHHACNRRCPRPEVARALIQAYPDALTKAENKGWRPLHYACRFKAPKEVVRLLLHMDPKRGRAVVSQRDGMGRTPLYYAVRYDAPPGVVGLLLEIDPSVVLDEDQNEDSPLALVWNSWAEKLEGTRKLQSFLPGGFPQPEDTSVDEQAASLRLRLRKEPKLFKRWKKANMLLKAAFGFPVEDDGSSFGDGNRKEAPSAEREWRIVHATAAVKCHISLFRLACALHPEQARELDENDLRWPGESYMEGQTSHQTALHHAASSNAGGEPGKAVIISLLSLHREAAQVQNGIDGSLPLHLIVENQSKQDWPNHGAILYQFYPRALQIPDNNGKLPLHRATAATTHFERDGDDEEALERSVIFQLVRSFPQAASHLDNSGCVPFHMVCIHGTEWDDDVEAVHNAHPNAVKIRAGRSHDNRLPLHMAAANLDARESLVSRLIQLHPRGASLMDVKGKLPLHLACELGKEWCDAGVERIHEAFPAAIRQAEGNARGWQALHMASSCPTASVELIDKLVDLNPEAAQVADSQGCYPLHLASGSGKNWLGGLKTLFEANPSAIASVDKKGLLPLHIAALRHCERNDHNNEDNDVDEFDKDVKKTDEAADAAKLDILFNILRADPTTILPMPF